MPEDSLWYKDELVMSVCMENYALKMTNVTNDVMNMESEIVHSEKLFLVLIPNPAGQGSVIEGKFDLGNTDSYYKLLILDATGKPVYTDGVGEDAESIEIDLSGLASGLYFVRLISDDAQITQRLMIK